MNILGVSAFYHDSAACLVRNGEIIAAAQEERFSRKKHDSSFPEGAVKYCLNEGGITAQDLDIVAFYDKPFIKFERILCTYLAYAPRGLYSFIKSAHLWLDKKLWIKDVIASRLKFKGKIIFLKHHQSHAASAFFPSPFKKSAFLTADGVGEWATTGYGIGEGNIIRALGEINFPHSLGLFYSAFTYYLGFKVNSGEYKLMGLAPYGKPRYKGLIFSELLDLKNDGSFRLNMKYFDYCAGLRMVNKRFIKLFKERPRRPESRLTQKHMDIAASVQKATEEVLLRMARRVREVTGAGSLCLAGGVALNCVANGLILRERIFDNVWIQPAAGDAGGALGAALFTWYQYLGNERVTGKKDSQRGSLLGPEYSDDYILNYLRKNHIPYAYLAEDKLIEETVDFIAAGKVIGWFQGRMEFGPRALGNRSIIADPRKRRMREVINAKVKFRESFRPFAPSVIAEKASGYFKMSAESPYMLLTFPVNGKLKKEQLIPAVTHVDNSARVQTVDKKTNPLYYKLIARFNEKYGCPAVINTSFNVRGEPVVCSPDDAYRCFRRSGIDCLVMGRYLVKKNGIKGGHKLKT